MADFDIPADLVQLRRDFVTTDAAWSDAGKTGDMDAGRRAYLEAQRLAEQILDHPWWQECGGNRFDARMALIAAAKN